MSTSDAVKPSCCKEKGLNGTQSKNAACSIKREPHKLKTDEPITPVVHAAICLKAFDDGQLRSAKCFLLSTPSFVLLHEQGEDRGSRLHRYAFRASASLF